MYLYAETAYMPTVQILQNIARHITLDKEEQDYFLSLITHENISRKQVLLTAGNQCRNIFYVNTGALRACFTDRLGKESTIMFAIADWWITDMYCFINQLPAMLTIEALADSNVFRLQRNDWETLLAAVPKFEKYFRVLMQNAYTREQLRVIQNLSIPAEERYNNFLGKYPQIVKQVTQKQIASYLGITPEFLSAIRAKKNKKIIS